MNYNNEKSPLIIPEYGRHVQQLVDHCLRIETRDERNQFAEAIIDVMGNLNPHLRDVPDFAHKLWDHLWIMSRFELDVDSPYEKPNPTILHEKPRRLEYPQSIKSHRYYGQIVQKMIKKCAEWEDGDKKDALFLALANFMKKSYLTWNKDQVDDAVIFEHLKALTNDKVDMTRESESLVQVSPQQLKQQKGQRFHAKGSSNSFKNKFKPKNKKFKK